MERQASSVPVRTHNPEMPNTRLRGSWLTAVRVFWVILFVLNLAWFGATLVAQVAAVEHPCIGPDCVFSPAQAETLGRLHINLSAFAVYFTGIPALAVLAGAVVAALLFWRRSDDWLALAVGIFLVIYPVTNFALFPNPPTTRGLALLTQVPNVIIYYGVFLIFPNGRFIPRWTWLLLAAWAVYIWGAVVLSALDTQAPDWTALAYPLLYLSALGAQVYRFRHVSDARQRQQTKWVILGFAVALLANIMFWIVLPSAVPAFQQPDTFYPPVAYPIYELATIALPASFAIAIQRHQLFDVDVLINRALVYGALTALLAAIYFGLVLGMQTLVQRLTGQSGQQPLFIVASTLVVAALFNPLRHRLQTTIDRRFYRRKYDAARTLAAFGNTLRTETDLGELSQHLVGVIEEAMQPASVSLWLAPTRSSTRSWNRPG